MAGNELGCARISMIARSISSNTRPDTLVRDHRLQSHDFPLQRTAGPYIGVKRFQAIPLLRCRHHSRARASLRNRHRGPSIMGFEDKVERSLGRPCRSCRQVQADMRTHLIHRPARDTVPPLGGARSFLLSHLIRRDCHAAAAISRVQRNSVPSTQMRCMITASRRAKATMSISPD